MNSTQTQCFRGIFTFALQSLKIGIQIRINSPHTFDRRNFNYFQTSDFQTVKSSEFAGAEWVTRMRTMCSRLSKQCDARLLKGRTNRPQIWVCVHAACWWWCRCSRADRRIMQSAKCLWFATFFALQILILFSWPFSTPYLRQPLQALTQLCDGRQHSNKFFCLNLRDVLHVHQFFTFAPWCLVYEIYYLFLSALRVALGILCWCW